MKRTLGDLTAREIEDRITNQVVLVRTDYNVRGSDGAIVSANRVRQSLPTIEWLIEHKAKVVVLSHCGRPFDLVKKLVETLPSHAAAMECVASSQSMDAVAELLQELLAEHNAKPRVTFVDECCGESVTTAVSRMPPGSILLLENSRLVASKVRPNASCDENCEAEFASEIVTSVQPRAYVFDGFSVCHRAHASVTGIADALRRMDDQTPVIAGKLLEQEIAAVVEGLSPEKVKRPYYAILGGAKVSGKGGKLAVIERLLDTADRLIIGGAMLYPFLVADHHDAGADPLGRTPEKVKIDVRAARDMLDKANGRILLPSQLCGLFPSTNDGTSQFRMRDVDADNLRTLLQTLDPPGTVVWNGPMGVFENARFRAGTSTCLQYLVDATKNHGAVTVAGGGDSEAAIEACLPEAAQVLSHISTGGGAMLAALAGEALPGIDMLDEV